MDDFFTVDSSGTETKASASEVGGGTSLATLPDKTLNGPVVYGGYGCPGSAPVPAASETFAGVTLAPGEEKILVLQRGPAFDPNEDYHADGDIANDSEDACFPGDKAFAAKQAGYDAVLLANRHQASGDERQRRAVLRRGGLSPDGDLVPLCTDHATLHRLFGDEPSFAIPADDEAELAPSASRARCESGFMAAGMRLG